MRMKLLPIRQLTQYDRVLFVGCMISWVACVGFLASFAIANAYGATEISGYLIVGMFMFAFAFFVCIGLQFIKKLFTWLGIISE